VGAVNNGTSAGNLSQSSAAAVTPPRSAPPAEQSVRTAPVANSSHDDTMNAVITATLGAVAVALAALLIVGWLMRRRRPTAAGTPQNPLPPSAASGPDKSPA
jgi:hypothetical protein